MFDTFIKALPGKSLTKNTGKAPIYLDTFGMGSIHVIKCFCLEERLRIRLPSIAHYNKSLILRYAPGVALALFAPSRVPRFSLSVSCSPWRLGLGRLTVAGGLGRPPLLRGVLHHLVPVCGAVSACLGESLACLACTPLSENSTFTCQT